MAIEMKTDKLIKHLSQSVEDVAALWTARGYDKIDAYRHAREWKDQADEVLRTAVLPTRSKDDVSPFIPDFESEQ